MSDIINKVEKVTGLRINIQSHEVDIEGDARDVLERLVAQYGCDFSDSPLN